MNVAEQTLELAGLRTTVVGAQSAVLTVILLHGYAMSPADLAPFAHSLRLPARFVLPRGPMAVAMLSWSDMSNPRMSAVMATIDVMPMTTPSTVRAERILFERTVSKAMTMTSITSP